MLDHLEAALRPHGPALDRALARDRRVGGGGRSAAAARGRRGSAHSTSPRGGVLGDERHGESPARECDPIDDPRIAVADPEHARAVGAFCIEDPGEEALVPLERGYGPATR